MKPLTRRKFIQTTATVAAATLITPKLSMAMPKEKKIGLQLYTVRDAVKEDLTGTIERIADIGYKYLEAAGFNDGKFYGLEPREFKTIVENNGMKVISSHASFTPDNAKQAIDAHAELGVDYLVFPTFPYPTHNAEDDFKQVAALLNRMGELCSSARIRFGYHNHDYEFELFGNQTGYDILMQNTLPDLVTFELDLAWAIYAKQDPVLLFEKYPGSFELWHVKDFVRDPEFAFTPVGTGIVGFQTIFDEKKLAGMKYYIVEQDSCRIDPMEAIAISWRNVNNLDF